MAEDIAITIEEQVVTILFPEQQVTLTLTQTTGDFAAASHTHTGTQVTVDASGFNGNLTTSDDTVQEIAQKLDDLVAGGTEVANVSSVLSFDLDGVFAPDDPVAFPPGFILAVVNQNVNPEWDGIYEGQANPSPAPMVRIGDLPETLMRSSYRVTQPSEVVAPLPGGLWAEDEGVWFFVLGSTLADLTDVDVVSDPPAQDDVLAWDDTAEKWTPATLEALGGGGADLSDAAPQDLGTAAAGVSDEASRADHVHDMPTAADITVDASGFNGNLTTSDDTVQEIAQKLDDLTIPAAGIADPGGANDDFLQRKAGAWAARTVAQVKTDLDVPPIGDLNPVWPNTTDGVGVAVLGGGSSAVLVGTVAVALGVTLLQTCTVSAVKIAVNSGGSTGAKARIGIYAAGSNGRPGSLVLDCGTVLIESGGTKTLTLGTPQQLTAGLYFFATSLDTGTSATIYGYASSTSGGQGSGGFRGAMPDNLFRSGAYSFATTGGAMTSTPTWTLGVSSGAICANIGLTIASVP